MSSHSLTAKTPSPAESVHYPESWWAVLRDLVWLGWPILIEQLLHFSVGFCDTYLSGRFGAAATEAVGICAYLGWLCSLIMALLGTGAMTLVSRHWGAGEFGLARSFAWQSMVMSVGMGSMLALGLWIAGPFAAQLMGVQGIGLDVATMYLRYESIGQFFSAIVIVGAATLRAAGDTRGALLILGTASFVNMLVSSALVFGWFGLARWGVTGIAAGTLMARMAAVLVLAWCCTRRDARLRFDATNRVIRADAIVRILRIGIPAAADGLLMFIGHFLFIRIVRLSGAEQGDVTFAAHVVGVHIEAASYLPAYALGQAGAVMMGQSLGAKLLLRARRSVCLAVFLGITYSALLGAGFYWFANEIFAVMHTDLAVAEIGTPAFRMMAFYQVPNAILIIVSAALRGAGDTRFPMWCSLVGCLMIRPVVAYFGGVYFGWGLWGAWLGMGADNICRATLVTLRFAQGGWKQTKV